MTDIKHTVCTVSGIATGIGNGHAVSPGVDGLHRIYCVSSTSSPTDIHPGTVGIAFLPLEVEAGAVRLNIEVNITPDGGVLVGDRLRGDGRWGRIVRRRFLKIIELGNFASVLVPVVNSDVIQFAIEISFKPI